jgi:Rho-binding antiterminator
VNKTDGNSNGYRPISCDTYSELEVAILHHTRLHLTWHDGNVCFTQAVMPVDLETQAGEEFLHVVLGSGERMRIRLDRIEHIQPA